MAAGKALLRQSPTGNKVISARKRIEYIMAVIRRETVDSRMHTDPLGVRVCRYP